MKKLQVIEPMHGGHHTNYLLALIPAIRQLKEAGILGHAVFTVTPRHLEMLTRGGHVAHAGDAVEWDGSLLAVSPGPDMKERSALFRAIRASVAQHRPDGLICTSADYDVIPNALANLLPKRTYWPKNSAGLMHYGLPKTDLSAKENIKRLVYETAWKFSNWKRLLMVNPVVYECLLERGKARPDRYAILPDPVPAVPDVTTQQARAALGVPLAGTYIGCVGMMDRRKAIPELLKAFAAMKAQPDVRLLLAGQLDEDYRRIVDTEYAQELRDGRILLIDRPLDNAELMAGYAALDLNAIVQYRRFNLSANVLKCVAFDKPFVCDQHGFTAMIARRFDAGVVCDVRDISSIAAALTAGLEKARVGRVGRSSRRLVDFHSHDNFARTALASVIGPRVHECLGRAPTWEHVYGESSRPGWQPSEYSDLGAFSA